jgi:hypothetical protein
VAWCVCSYRYDSRWYIDLRDRTTFDPLPLRPDLTMSSTAAVAHTPAKVPLTGLIFNALLSAIALVVLIVCMGRSITGMRIRYRADRMNSKKSDRTSWSGFPEGAVGTVAVVRNILRLSRLYYCDSDFDLGIRTE